jgi:hypothetical protein
MGQDRRLLREPHRLWGTIPFVSDAPVTDEILATIGYFVAESMAKIENHGVAVIGMTMGWDRDRRKCLVRSYPLRSDDPYEWDYPQLAPGEGEMTFMLCDECGLATRDGGGDIVMYFHKPGCPVESVHAVLRA